MTAKDLYLVGRRGNHHDLDCIFTSKHAANHEAVHLNRQEWALKTDSPWYMPELYEVMPFAEALAAIHDHGIEEGRNPPDRR